MMKDFNPMVQLQRVLIFFLPFLFSLCFHEFAHAWMSKRRGDRTAEMMGRLSLSPFAHADLFGTVILPLTAVFFNIPLFGWAKPVPVNSRHLKNPRNDMFWIAAAGPLSNLFLALMGTLFVVVALRVAPELILGESASSEAIRNLVIQFVFINLILAFFNLLPVHPLDGANVLARFLPEKWNRALEDAQAYTNLILMVLILSGALSHLIFSPVYKLGEFLLYWSGFPL